MGKAVRPDYFLGDRYDLLSHAHGNCSSQLSGITAPEGGTLPLGTFPTGDATTGGYLTWLASGLGKGLDCPAGAGKNMPLIALAVQKMFGRAALGVTEIPVGRRNRQ
jgi:hypothetical protein